MSKISPEGVKIYALGCALIGCSPSVAQSSPQPRDLRGDVPLGPLAQKWSEGRVEEAQSNWLKAAKLSQTSSYAKQIKNLRSEAASEGIVISEKIINRTLGILDLAPSSNLHISYSTQGEIVCEWWKDEKRVTFYVGSGETWFVKSWGSDMISDMEDGLISSTSEMKVLWTWLQTL